MNKSLNITATLDQPELLENLVEKLAYRRVELGYGKAVLPRGREAIETSSNDTYVSGTMELSGANLHINMPFITRFVFTCIKGKNDPYKLCWGTSLS